MNISTIVRSGVILLVIVSISGCISLRRGFDLDDGRSILVSPDERAITSTAVKRTSTPGQIHPVRVICSEPSPDVAKALEKSLQAALSVKGQGEGSFSSSTAEAAIQLAERTASIQVLRDRMHHICQDYANGAISGSMYSVEMGRLNDAMVSLVLGETAGGAFGRAGASAGGKASGSINQTMSDSLVLLEDLIEEEQDLEETVDEKKAELDTAEKLAKETADDAQEKDATDSDEEEAEQAEDTVKGKEAELAVVKERLAGVREQVERTTEQVLSSSAEITSAAGHGGINASPTSEIAEILAGMQGRYLDRSVAKDFITSCIVEMSQTHSLADNKDILTAEINKIRTGKDRDETTLEDIMIAAERAVAASEAQAKSSVNKESTLAFYKKRLEAAELAYLKKPTSNSLQLIAENAYEDYAAEAFRSTKSVFSHQCREMIYWLVTDEQKNGHELSLRKISATIDIKKSKLEEIRQAREAQASCIKLSGDERRVCLNTVAKAIDKSIESAPNLPKKGPTKKPATPVPWTSQPYIFGHELSEIVDRISVLESLIVVLQKTDLKEVTADEKTTNLSGQAKTKATLRNTLRADARLERAKLVLGIAVYKNEIPAITSAKDVVKYLQALDNDKSKLDGPDELRKGWRVLVGKLAEEQGKASKNAGEILRLRVDVTKIEQESKKIVGQISQRRAGLDKPEASVRAVILQIEDFLKKYKDLLF